MKRPGWLVKGNSNVFFIDPINNCVYVYLGIWVPVCYEIKNFGTDGFRVYRGVAKGDFLV